jgi:putative transcriptional regulator
MQSIVKKMFTLTARGGYTGSMGISFSPLLAILEERELRIGYLREAVGLSGATVAKINKGEPVTFEVLDRICSVMGLRIDEVIQHEEVPFKKAKPREKQNEDRRKKKGKRKP